jgi:hypothetical protein
MVYEHLSRCFILEDPFSRFLKLFQVIIIVVCGDIFKLVAPMPRANILLAMAKDNVGLYPIVTSEVFFGLVNHPIVL